MYLLLSIILITSWHTATCIAEWNFFTYMQVEKDLSSFAPGNIEAMKEVGSNQDLNVLVQITHQNNPLTHRMKIVQHSAQETTLQYNRKYNPSQNLIDAAKWINHYHPAKHFVLNLWSHGTGAVTRSLRLTTSANRKSEKSPCWLGPFQNRPPKLQTRSILYTGTKNEYLSLPMLGITCSKIAATLGHKINILSADACLMGMIEVAYEIRESVEYFVASEQIIPPSGLPYTRILEQLALHPKMPASQLASTMVNAYEDFYTHNNAGGCSDFFTLSTIQLVKISAAVRDFIALAEALRTAYTINPVATGLAFRTARSTTQHVDIDKDFPFVDLVDFYDNIIEQFSQDSKPPYISKRTPSGEAEALITENAAAIATIIATAEAAKESALSAVLHAAASATYQGRTNGISIYFPQSTRIDRLYRTTQFAQDTGWPELIATMYRRL